MTIIKKTFKQLKKIVKLFITSVFKFFCKAGGL